MSGLREWRLRGGSASQAPSWLGFGLAQLGADGVLGVGLSSLPASL